MLFRFLFCFCVLLTLHAPKARAEFIISSSILEFSSGSPSQKDVELISHSKEHDYIAVDLSEILNPGLTSEERKHVSDPTQSNLLVTPNKSILTGGSRKTLRFVLLKPLDDKEHIYRASIKPVIKGVEAETLIGLKVLIGYEVLVIIRPKDIRVAYDATRDGKVLTIRNQGNSNILFQHGSQCPEEQKCTLPPPRRVYPNETAQVELPLSRPVTYSIWDGKTTTEKTF